MLDKIKSFPYFREAAFVIAIILILWAWKNGIEGLVE